MKASLLALLVLLAAGCSKNNFVTQSSGGVAQSGGAQNNGGMPQTEGGYGGQAAGATQAGLGGSVGGQQAGGSAGQAQGGGAGGQAQGGAGEAGSPAQGGANAGGSCGSAGQCKMNTGQQACDDCVAVKCAGEADACCADGGLSGCKVGLELFQGCLACGGTMAACHLQHLSSLDSEAGLYFSACVKDSCDLPGPCAF